MMMMMLQSKTFTLTFPLHFPSSSSSSLSPPSLSQSQIFNFKPSLLSLTLNRRRILPITACVVEEKNQPTSEPEPEPEPEPSQSDLASELKKAMQERKDKEGGDNLWNGVVSEIGEIEWPEFGKVLGTTGVVLSVIFGSSVVLLTVNAILSELSDKVFAGKGVQDFFS
ncbi:preprotein translocase subunit SECE1 [Cicer arietinum]|uniref:Preprotein translocase subunit SECE1 n=1 Tax=Cicer arietinum TaxID=3827 RepID=A0A1S2XIV5_CICAR|nr:preprotein translocase subunit SECE1 [Cicer arietinum]